MKYILTILIAFIGISISSGQNQRAERKAQLDALKVRYFTEELDLSEKESEAFWPLFYQFEKKQQSVKKTIKVKTMALEDSNPSEKEFMNALLEIEKLAAILPANKTQFVKDCIPILGLEKAIKLVTLEDKLRKRITERIRTKMED